MADFDKAIGHILKWEGKFSDHPADPGAATMRGITFNTFKKYAHVLLGIEPTLENLKALTEDQAKIIYKEVYWRRINGDNITDQNIANAIFDGHVNMGKWGITLMQKEAGVKPDGVIGPNSLAAFNSANPHILFDGYKDAREDYYRRLSERKPQMKVFLKGWLNRINDLTFNVGIV